MSNHGTFSGDPKTRWISNPNGRDRDMELLEDFSYTDPDGRVWPALTGSVVNGASIPSFLWSTVGSPYTDNYRNASVVHDIACLDPNVDRFEADQMFYHACLAGGCSVKEAKKLYIGVRFGAWMEDCHEAPPVPPGTPLFCFANEMPVSIVDNPVVFDQFDKIRDDIARLDESADLVQIDAIISLHTQIE